MESMVISSNTIGPTLDTPIDFAFSLHLTFLLWKNLLKFEMVKY